MVQFPGLLHLQFSIAYSMQKDDSVEGLRKRQGMQLWHTNMLGILCYRNEIQSNLRTKDTLGTI